MKIALGINTYCADSCLSKRQLLCQESLVSLKERYGKNIDLVNIQFEDEKYDYKCFDNTVFLNRSSRDVITSPKKKLPLSLDVFNALCNLDYTYFVYLNDDIIVKPRLIEVILEEGVKYDTFVSSRMDISILDNIKEKPVYKNYNTHGFDLFAVNSLWWRDHSKYFPNFILGRYYWDAYYYSVCNTLGRTKTLNTLPPYILHQEHEGVSSPNDNEHMYNELQANNIFLQAWFANVRVNLGPRASYSGIKNCIPNVGEEDGINRFYKEFYEKNISSLRR